MAHRESLNDLIEKARASRLPTHVAIILDGNGRWARKRNLPREEGHVAGAQAVECLIQFIAKEVPLEYLTLFAFSAENWSRPAQEVNALMALLRQFALEKLLSMKDEGIRLRVLGDISRLPQATRDAVKTALDETKAGQGLNLTIALNYGGQQEILRACQRIARAIASGELSEDAVSRSVFEANLYTAGIPDPDLIIRTSGEERLSNFFLWQAAYAEFAFSETLWPDFTPEEFLRILIAYQARDRRFGGAVEGE